VTEEIVPSATVAVIGLPGATSLAPAAGEVVTAAGFAAGGGAWVGPPPDVPLALTVGSLLHAPSVSAATSPSTATPARRRVKFPKVTLVPIRPL
jgi:hypothetical protein